MTSHKTTLTALSSISATLVFANFGSAATVAQFDFDNQDLTSSDPGTSWTTTDLSKGAGLGAHSFETDVARGSSVPSLFIRYPDFNPGVSDNLDGALAEANYLSFTVTPESPTINFTDFSIDMRRRDGGAFIGAYLFSEIDGFDAGDVIDGVEHQVDTFTTYNFDLSSISSTAVSSPTEFRLYIYTNGNNGFNGGLFDNLVLEGTAAAIPEPHAALLSALGAVLLLRRRRQK